MVTVPPPPPLNPAEAPIDVPPLPALPPSVSNLAVDPVDDESPDVLEHRATSTSHRAPEFWIVVGAMLTNTLAALGFLGTRRISPTAAVVLLVAGQAIGAVYVLARAWIAVQASGSRDAR